ncbi:unnamed protein product [Agarophyton chilense]
MPPKKKKAEEQKKKIVEDKTFGLKNKKKSRKVQQYVETVKKQANQKVDGPRKRSEGAGSSSAAGSARLAQMQARLAELELMNQPVKEKQKKLSAEEEERKRLEEEAEKERIRIANLPVEDQIEEERAKLTSRTPVTKDLFLKWKEEKTREKKAEEEVKKAAAFKKMSKAERSRGQGLSGRELFQSNAEIFVDDEEADDTVLKTGDEFIESSDENGATFSGVRPDASLFEEEAVDVLHETHDVTIGDESLFT